MGKTDLVVVTVQGAPITLTLLELRNHGPRDP